MSHAAGARVRITCVMAALLLAPALSGCTGDAPPPEGPSDEGDAAPDAPPHGGGHMAAMDLSALAGDLPSSAEDLPASRPSEEVRLADGDTFDLVAAPVAHDPGLGHAVPMLAYNGQIPGPVLRVPVGARITVLLHNDMPLPTTVHWHGLRLASRYDGVPGVSQDPVPPGGVFRYELAFPDEGVFWFHPHVREDIEQELGLVGVIISEGPRGADERWPVERVLVLDDVLTADGEVAPLGYASPERVMMGRYGDRLLVNGASGWNGTAAPEERVRLVLLDSASARPFSLRFEGAASVELIAADGGYFAEPTALNGSLFVSPGERRIVDVVMPGAGDVRIVNHIPGGDEILGRLGSSGAAAGLDTGPPMGPHERARVSLEPALAHLDDAPTITWELGMRVLNASWAAGMGILGNSFRHARHDLQPGEWPPGIAWTDFVPAINAGSDTTKVRWLIRDAATLDENEELAYDLPAGSFVTVRIDNPATGSNHMQHPFHIHGQRFIVLRSALTPEPEMVWRDTVLIPTDTEAVLLLEVSNPGAWVYHCHISEHMEAGMMGRFTVV